MSSNVEDAKKKLVELNQALNVVEDVDERVSWACDFASYPSLVEKLTSILDAVSYTREKLEEEIEYIEEQIEDFDCKLASFVQDNPIYVER
jgi:uncharacterized protein YoxC